MSATPTTWSFTNVLGRLITTGSPATAEQYRHDPRFTEVTGDDAKPQGYSGWLKADLEDEVDNRNDGRDDEDRVVPAEPGNKPQLIQALEADDAANA